MTLMAAHRQQQAQLQEGGKIGLGGALLLIIIAIVLYYALK